MTKIIIWKIWYKIKKVDEAYRKNLNIPKYILMITVRIAELSKEVQNQIGLYLLKNISFRLVLTELT